MKTDRCLTLSALPHCPPEDEAVLIYLFACLIFYNFLYYKQGRAAAVCNVAVFLPVGVMRVAVLRQALLTSLAG